MNGRLVMNLNSLGGAIWSRRSRFLGLLRRQKTVQSFRDQEPTRHQEIFVVGRVKQRDVGRNVLAEEVPCSAILDEGRNVNGRVLRTYGAVS